MTRLTSLALLSTLLWMTASATSAPAPQGTGSFTAPPTLGGGNPNLFFKAVRAEYVDLSGNSDEVDTVVHIANTSGSTLLTLRDVYVLGPGGTQQVLGVETRFRGRLLPPLGHVELTIDNKIPGVWPELTPDERRVETVVVSWSGPADALRLTSLIHLERPGNDDNRTRFEIEGYDITP